jgi:pSer/pThr/pTyr-binding forkhead associated (FHA) protein
MNDRPSYRLVPSLGTYELMTIAPAQNVLIGRSAVVPVPPSGQLPTFYVRISDPTISKQHAHLALSADGTVLTLTDVSTNGTFVDGLRVPRGSAMELESGDVLSFATTDQQSVTLPFFKVMLVTKTPEPVSEPAPPPETHIDKRDSVSVENVAFTLTLKIGEVTVESAKAIGVATVDSAKAVGTATAGGAAYVGKKSLEGAKAFGDGVKATGSLVATGLEKTLMTLGVTAVLAVMSALLIYADIVKPISLFGG